MELTLRRSEGSFKARCAAFDFNVSDDVVNRGLPGLFILCAVLAFILPLTRQGLRGKYGCASKRWFKLYFNSEDGEGMNYLTLYRQWRPQTFSEVVGQKNTVTGLRNAVREGKLAHAYLFFGPRGSGKTSVAKIMAKAVNCSQPGSGEPCNTCPACCDINNGSFMDVGDRCRVQPWN